ncbi:MAG: hypothetical protein L6R40_007479 [Gallowayella cf. fulva]|nr:MAG: hypothetical protein L6R40_007479 [Xanthomendoza cf. fulva]
MPFTERQAATSAFADAQHLDEKNATKEEYPTVGPSSHSDDEGDRVYAIKDKALLRKLDLKLLPALTLLYLLSFLDRSNVVANARVEGLVPCNIVLKLTSPQQWLPTLTLAWGIVATLLGVVQNMSGFFAARFFLGVAESGLFPGVVFYLSMWYRREEQHYRVSLFFSAASLAGAFGGVLAWGIAHMNGVGNLGGWRWIFILEGLLTIVVSIAAYFFIYNYPATATFLTDEERARVLARLKASNDATRDEAFSWKNVSLAVKDPKVWLYCLGFHTMSLPLYTLSLFLPTIIKELGYTAAEAQLLTVPVYSVATVLTVIVAVASEKTKIRAPFIMGTSSLAVIGYIVLLTNTKPSVAYGGTVLAAAGIYPSVAIVLSWPANNVSGQTKRATANAMQISIGNLGAVLGTQLYRSTDGPRFFRGHGFAMGYLVANVLVVGTLWAVLRAENARRDRGERNDRLNGVEEEEWLGDDDPRWRFQT